MLRAIECIREERLARWLLLTHDRVRKNEFVFTQEFMSHMLGVRRAGVSVAANTLRRAGLIDYQRGEITVLNRSGPRGRVLRVLSHD